MRCHRALAVAAGLALGCGLLGATAGAAQSAPANLGDATWADVSPAEGPPAIGGAAMAYDAGNRQVVMFGGNLFTFPVFSLSAATWLWAGGTWTELESATSPRARQGHMMVYDEARQEIVLFGGVDQSNTILADTWVFDGETWTERAPADSPSPRHSAEMAYDPLREEVVMFGGTFGFRQTWVWDGANWEPRFPETRPAHRSHPGMAWDRSRDAVILFGGNGKGNASLSDTWSWDGQDWTEVVLERRPRGLAELSMASFGGQVVRFGGTSLGDSTDGTWVLKADRWQRIARDVAPSARGSAALAYDRAEGEGVLFGGIDRTGPEAVALDDTWVLEH